MTGPGAFARDTRASAAVEMVLVTPLLLALMFGSMELGNYFLDQHAVTKSVRDGARYASRLTLNSAYACPGTVFADATFDQNIKNVTKTGTIDGTGAGRFPATFWADACPRGTALQVSVRCVPKTDYGGIYASLDGEIPVVKVSANVRYPSVLGSIGFDAARVCIRAESEAAVAGL